MRAHTIRAVGMEAATSVRGQWEPLMGYWGEEGERLLGVSSNGHSRKAKHFVTGTLALCPSHLMKTGRVGSD